MKLHDTKLFKWLYAIFQRKRASAHIRISFTQQEIDLLATVLDECAFEIALERFQDSDEELEALHIGVDKIFRYASPQEDETVLLPAGIFPPQVLEYMVENGMARPAQFPEQANATGKTSN